MLSAVAVAALLALRPVPAQAAAAAPAVEKPLPNDAVLLVVDAFNIVRMLDDKDYEARKLDVARNLVRNLRPFLLPAPGGAVPPAPVGRKPAATAPKPGVAAPKTTSGAPRREPVVKETRPAPKHGAETKPAARHEAKPHAKSEKARRGSAYARVPQKKRIRAKFQAAEQPYEKLLKSRPQEAAVIGEVLKAARAALADGHFNASESYIDHALELLGVQYKGKE